MIIKDEDIIYGGKIILTSNNGCEKTREFLQYRNR